MLRYPSAALENRNKISRGGHVWFQRNSAKAKSRDGLEPNYIGGKLATEVRKSYPDLDNELPMIAPQALPPFNSKQEESDSLFGRDLLGVEAPREHPEAIKRRKVFLDLPIFDSNQHSNDQHRSGGNTSDNRESRRRDRESRRGPHAQRKENVRDSKNRNDRK